MNRLLLRTCIILLYSFFSLSRSRGLHQSANVRSRLIPVRIRGSQTGTAASVHIGAESRLRVPQKSSRALGEP